MVPVWNTMNPLHSSERRRSESVPRNVLTPSTIASPVQVVVDWLASGQTMRTDLRIRSVTGPHPCFCCSSVSLDSTRSSRYRNVPEGAGHTYTFDLAKEDRIRWIGTTGCNTCAGTYFSISEEKCFVGHWNYEVQRDDVEAGSTSRMRLLRLATESFRDASEYLISDYAFDWIRRDVKKKLADWQWSCGWGPVTTRMRASLTMICPHCDSSDAGRRYVGDAVAAGLKEFLCIIDDDLQPVKAQSFIVRHDGSRRPEVRFFETENPGSESQRWQRLNHEDNHRCEQSKVRDDRSAVQELELDDPVALGEPEDSAVVGM